MLVSAHLQAAWDSRRRIQFDGGELSVRHFQGQLDRHEGRGRPPARSPGRREAEGSRSMKAPLDMSPAAVTARLRRASELSDLSISRAGEGKVSFEPAAVSARLRMVSQLRELGLRLRRAGAAADETR
jgi:hypothetical protein